MRNHLLLGLVLVTIVCCASSAAAQGWGNLKGKFVLEGKTPKAVAIKVDKDPKVCADPANPPLVNEDLVVSANGGIRDILVTLYVKPGGAKPPLDKDAFAAAIKKSVTMDNNKCRFEPRVCMVYAGQELIVTNTDSTGHNVNGGLSKNTAFNEILPVGGKISKTLKFAERAPMPVSCNIHPWMKGWLVVRDDPYMAVSAADGTFTISHVPAGKWNFQAWQERSGYVKSVKLGDKAVKWEKGVFEATIKDGETVDLGTIQVPLEVFRTE